MNFLFFVHELNWRNQEYLSSGSCGCLVDVLNENYESLLTPDWLKQHSWMSMENNSGHLVPELGLEKFNMGLWRREENMLPEAESVAGRAFQRLGLFSSVPESSPEDTQSIEKSDNSLKG